MDSREERIGKNEAVFREVNERLKELGESFSFVAERADFVCECGDALCADPIQMTLAEYEHVRANASRFAVLPGHSIREVESVVERRHGYDIVEKHPGRPAQLAAANDPRRR